MAGFVADKLSPQRALQPRSMPTLAHGGVPSHRAAATEVIGMSSTVATSGVDDLGMASFLRLQAGHVCVLMRKNDLIVNI